jgi:heme A synthase
VVVPWSPAIETMIEFSHRLSSGLALLLVIGLIIWAFRAYPAGHVIRQGAGAAMLLMIVESLVGAALVLFGWVAGDTSTARAIVVPIHLVNTFLLLAAITLTAWWASGGLPLRFKGHGWLGGALWAGFIGMLILGASGGLIALGDTLFPAATFAEGWEQKFDPNAPFLVQLRAVHPLIAILLGAYIAIIMNLYVNQSPDPLAKRLSQLFIGLYTAQLIVGSFNVVLLAPVWLQIFHLLVTDTLFILLVLFMAIAFSQQSAGQSVSKSVGQSVS